MHSVNPGSDFTPFIDFNVNVLQIQIYYCEANSSEHIAVHSLN